MTQAAVSDLNHEARIDSPIKRELGMRIKEAREKLDITQEEMAVRISKGRSAVAQWELGRSTPTLPDIEKLAKTLKVTPGWIAFGQKDASKDNVQVPFVVFESVTEFTRKGVLEIPRTFLQGLGRPRKASLVAVTINHDEELPGLKRGEVVLIDTDDKELVGDSAHAIWDDYFGFAEAAKVSGKPREISLTVGEEVMQLPKETVPVVGRVIATLTGYRM